MSEKHRSYRSDKYYMMYTIHKRFAPNRTYNFVSRRDMINTALQFTKHGHFSKVFVHEKKIGDEENG